MERGGVQGRFGWGVSMGQSGHLGIWCVATCYDFWFVVNTVGYKGMYLDASCLGLHFVVTANDKTSLFAQ